MTTFISGLFQSMTPQQYVSGSPSKEEELASLGMRWEVWDFDAAYDQALAEQQQAALAALQRAREESSK